MKRLALLLMIVVSMAFAKTASEYYKEASFLYIENRLPSAEILCEEALAKYPQDQKLQMLLDRIREAKEEQKNQNQKNNSENQKDDSEKDKNQDEQNQENQDNQSGNENKENENSSESSSSNGENQGENKNENQNSNNNHFAFCASLDGKRKGVEWLWPFVCCIYCRATPHSRSKGEMPLLPQAYIALPLDVDGFLAWSREV